MHKEGKKRKDYWDWACFNKYLHVCIEISTQEAVPTATIKWVDTAGSFHFVFFVILSPNHLLNQMLDRRHHISCLWFKKTLQTWNLSPSSRHLLLLQTFRFTFMRKLSNMFTDTTLQRTDQGHVCDITLKLICMLSLGHLLNQFLFHLL